MNTADQIAEINAQYAERVKLLERERDAKVAMVRERCVHEAEVWYSVFLNDPMTTGICKHCGAPMP